MAIPPRRTPRDRFFVGAGGPPTGGGGGAAPGVHTHLEADITDLDKYTQAAADAKFVEVGGDTMTGLLVLSAGPSVDLGAATKKFVDDHTWIEADITDLDKYTQAAADAKFVEVAGDVMTGDLVINQGSNVASRLVLGEQTVSRGSSQDGTIVMFGENADTTIDRWTLAATGVNFSIAHLAGDGALQLSADMDVLTGHFLKVRDSTNADDGKWSHDGTDFNLALTNTTDYNITGIGGSLKVDSGATFAATVSVTGKVEITGTWFQVTASTPRYRWFENDQTTDKGAWDFLATGGTLLLRTLDDSFANPVTAMSVTRTGTTVDGVDFLSTALKHNGTQVALEVMTTNGDTLFYNSGRQRLAKGSDDQVLTLASGLPTWATPVSGFADPLTTDGDIMIRDTTTIRLAVGTNSQVLTVTSGIPAWEDSVSGVTDHGALTGLGDDDHTQYAKLAGDTFTGVAIFSNVRTRMTSADPALIWTQTGATADEGVWRIVARTNQLRFGTLNDAESVAGNQMVFNRNGTAAQRVDIYGALRVLDLGETDHAEWTHDGTDLNLVLTNTTDYLITGSTHMFVDANLQVKGGNILRVLDAGGTDWGQIAHGGTNMTFSMVNTTNFVFSGITGNYGFEDGQILIDNLKSFRSINAATSGSISLAELDASDVGQFMIGGETAEFGGNILPATGGTGFLGTVTKAWSDAILETAHINILADAATFLHIGEASTLRGSSQRGNLRIWGETGAAAITQVTFQNTGSNLNITHSTGSIQFGSRVDILSNKGLLIRDSTNSDSGLFEHDGTDFNLTLVNTTDFNITGLTNLTVGGTNVALEVMTTNGDILFYNSGRQRLAKGTDGQVLTLASGIPSWAAGGGGGGSFTFFDPDANPNAAETEDDEFEGTSLDAKWTFVNQDSVVATVADDLLKLNISTNTGNMRRIEQSIPAGTTWRIRAKVLMTGPNAAQSHIGIEIQDGTARLLTMGCGWSTTQSIFVFRFLSAGSFSSTAATFNFEGNEELRSWKYLEIERDGNNLNFRYSANGLEYFQIHTETIASFITNAPTKFGIFVFKATTGVTVNQYVDWFRFKGDLTTQMQGDQRTVSTP